ncbi:Astacin-like metalloprotease toxin 1 [Orchesella cincta]|uniref:Metalloendopeptidase n=1 Tax=Orchesella cincta TaxID=48709 RepID=A0A1D2M848_ORCCI|nr:Astacin-like metalloprotease toxin 1 [Orchesella cincta]
MTRQVILIVERGFEEFQSKTCIRFARSEAGNQDFVSIEVDNTICAQAHVCKRGGTQFIRVGKRCMNMTTIIHALGHTLCLGHENQRSDRDKYLTFRNCNPIPRKRIRNIYIKKGIYDYASQMSHECNWCAGGWPTMPNVTKCGPVATPGLSVLDADRINDRCYRHRWRPIESLSFKDKTNLYGFGYEKLYVCRAMIEGGIVAGKFDLDSKICLIYYNFKMHVVKDIFEVLTIPGGLNRHCSVYSLVHRNKSILANALPVGTQVDSNGYWNSYIALGEVPTGNCSSECGVGNTWVYNRSGFWNDANLVVRDVGALSSNYKVSTCEWDVKSPSFIKTKLVEGPNIFQPQGNANNFSQTHENTQQSLPTLYISVGTVLLCLLLLLICISSFFFMRYKKMKRFLTETEYKEFFDGRLRLTNLAEDRNGIENEGVLVRDDIDALKFYEHFKLLRNQITIDVEQLLGSGAFGVVYAGTAKGIKAAIKVPKPGCSLETFKSFLSEVKVMGYLGSHENILGFIGAYVNEIQYGTIQDRGREPPSVAVPPGAESLRNTDNTKRRTARKTSKK